VIPFGELKSQFFGIESEIRAAIDEVLDKAWYIHGEQCKAFEAEFAAYTGTEYAVGVASGTEAIQLALMATGVGPGDAVITAANTCVPTAAAISATGATPVLVDVDPVTMTMDPDKIEAAITPRTRAIVPVHLYGHPCDVDAILAVAEAHGVPVIEDCAQAHGTEYTGRCCGTFGAAGAFSFYPSKNLGAYGDGGAITTNDGALAEKLRILRNYGEERRYYHSCKGINSRLDEIQAAILRVKLRHLDEWNAARRERAAKYLELLKDVPLVLPHEAAWGRHNYHLFVVRSPHRDDLQTHLKKQGIATFLHYPVPIHLQEAYADLHQDRGAFPETEKTCDEVLSLPMYAELPFDHIKRVAKAIHDFPF